MSACHAEKGAFDQAAHSVEQYAIKRNCGKWLFTMLVLVLTLVQSNTHSGFLYGADGLFAGQNQDLLHSHSDCNPMQVATITGQKK